MARERDGGTGASSNLTEEIERLGRDPEYILFEIHRHLMDDAEKLASFRQDILFMLAGVLASMLVLVVSIVWVI